MRGINLGGWFIPESWLTPGVFSGTGAEDLDALVNSEEGRERYRAHLDGFIDESDFKWLAENSIGLIRLPVGYWTLDSYGDYPSTLSTLDWTMAMAEKYNLSILIDLHAVQGSQNGNVHSGKIGKAEWLHSQKYQEETIEILKGIAKRYNSSSSFWGIELVNEPKMGFGYFKLLRFYRRAYRELRKVLRPGVYTVFHDAFHPILFTGALFPRKDFPVVFDAHWYVIAPAISDKVSFSTYQRLQRYLFGSILWFLQRWQPVIVGEWSTVLPQGMFNRVPQKRHYDLLASNSAAQQDIYSPALATMYWTYKAEGKGMWNFRSLVEAGVIVLK